MLTLNDAKQEVARREGEVESAVRAVADAQGAVDDVRRRGDGTDRPEGVQITDAKGRVAHAQLAEKRAREALKEAQAAIEHVAAHEAEFSRLNEIAAALAEKDAALVALGLETRKRIAAEIAEVRALFEEAQRIQSNLPGDVIVGSRLLPPVTRWAGVAPGQHDLLTLLARATAAAQGS